MFKYCTIYPSDQSGRSECTLRPITSNHMAHVQYTLRRYLTSSCCLPVYSTTSLLCLLSMLVSVRRSCVCAWKARCALHAASATRDFSRQFCVGDDMQIRYVCYSRPRLLSTPIIVYDGMRYTVTYGVARCQQSYAACCAHVECSKSKQSLNTPSWFTWV